LDAAKATVRLIHSRIFRFFTQNHRLNAESTLDGNPLETSCNNSLAHVFTMEQRRILFFFSAGKDLSVTLHA